MSPAQAPHEIAAEAIDLFLEYRDVHGYDEQAAKVAAAGEFIDGAPGECEPHPHWNMMTESERDEAIKKAI